MLMSQVLSNQIIGNMEDGIVRQWLEAELPSILSFFWSIVLALIVWFIGSKIIKGIRKAGMRAMIRHDRDEGVRQFLDSLTKWALYIVLLIVILNLFGVTTTSIVAAVASLGVTAGLALQGALSNFAGGVLILLLHPFRVGDYIVEDTSKNEGTVTEITIFYTKLMTVDKRTVVIPNGTLANASLTNNTSAGERMEDLTVSISYSDDIDRAKAILLELAEAEEKAIKNDPNRPIFIFVRELGGSSIDLGVRFYTGADDFWTTKWHYIEAVKKRFDAEGITIPFQQLDVHFDPQTLE